MNPHRYYTINNADTNKPLGLGGVYLTEAEVKTKLLAPRPRPIPLSAIYVTTWYGIGHDTDAIESQVSADEFLGSPP